VFWVAIFSLSRAFLSSATCSRFVSFVSRKRQFLLPFEDHQFGCFQTKIKTNAFPPLSLHEQRLAPMNAQKGKR
jgi:hypothetical protein